MSEENLKLWKAVEKTDPKQTKKANVGGNKITSISPQYQIMNATQQFGSYGIGWGFKEINIDYSLISLDMVVFKAKFFFPNGEFEIINSIKLYKDNAKTKIDDDFAKKLETDTLTKALSKLGFNADVFMGKHDDSRYLAEVEEELRPTPPPKTKAKVQWNEEMARKAIAANCNLDQFKQSVNVSEEQEQQYTVLQNEFSKRSSCDATESDIH